MISEGWLTVVKKNEKKPGHFSNFGNFEWEKNVRFVNVGGGRGGKYDKFLIFQLNNICVLTFNSEF